MVNSLNLTLPAPAPPVAEPIVVGFSTPNEKSLISNAFSFENVTSLVSPSGAEPTLAFLNQMNASTAMMEISFDVKQTFPVWPCVIGRILHRSDRQPSLL